MSNYDSAKALITAFSGQHNIIGVPRAFCKFMKSLEGGIFLSQLIFWSDKGKRADGWFYKSYKEWQEETFLSQYKVSKYTDVLVNQGVLEIKIKKANGAPTLHYRFDYEKFNNLFIEFLTMDSIKISQSITETTTVDYSEDLKDGAAKTPAPPPTQKPLELTLTGPKEKPKPQRRPKATRKPVHPSITTFRENAHRYPAKAWYGKIEDAVGDSEKALELWGSVVLNYVGMGWNPQNVKGMLEFFERGEIPKSKGNGRGNDPPRRKQEYRTIATDRAAGR